MLKELEAGDIINPQIETLIAAAEILKGRPDLDYCYLTEPVCNDKWLLGRHIKTFKQLQPFILLIKLRNQQDPRIFETALNIFQLNGYFPNGACEPELEGQCLSPTIFWPRDLEQPLFLENDEQRLRCGIKLPKQLNPSYTGTMIPISRFQSKGLFS